MKCDNCAAKKGLIYALIPHAGCIAFIISSILGTTLLTQLFKPLLMNKNFFNYLLIISFLLATITSYFYLKKNKTTIREEWKYLTITYSTTIGVNLLLFLIIFPALANIGYQELPNNALLYLKVNIPCSGHAALIASELKTINGVNAVKYDLPNKFLISYDQLKTTKERILSLPVFIEYAAIEI